MIVHWVTQARQVSGEVKLLALWLRVQGRCGWSQPSVQVPAGAFGNLGGLSSRLAKATQGLAKQAGTAAREAVGQYAGSGAWYG